MAADEMKSINLKRYIPLLLGAVIIAVGFIISAFIFANATNNRTMTGSFSGDLYSGSIVYPDIMDMDMLMQYLDISPNVGENYDEAIKQLYSDTQKNIMNGTWPGFPYVKLNERLYFSKQAVNDWFAEMGKQQYVIN